MHIVNINKLDTFDIYSIFVLQDLFYNFNDAY